MYSICLALFWKKFSQHRKDQARLYPFPRRQFHTEKIKWANHSTYDEPRELEFVVNPIGHHMAFVANCLLPVTIYTSKMKARFFLVSAPVRNGSKSRIRKCALNMRQGETRWIHLPFHSMQNLRGNTVHSTRCRSFR